MSVKSQVGPGPNLHTKFIFAIQQIKPIIALACCSPNLSISRPLPISEEEGRDNRHSSIAMDFTVSLYTIVSSLQTLRTLRQVSFTVVSGMRTSTEANLFCLCSLFRKSQML